MDQPEIRVLLVSLPGIYQRILHGTLGSRPDVEVVAVASGGLSAVQAVEQENPDVVVIDSNLPEEEALEMIKIIRAILPGGYVLVLVETTPQMHRLSETGADLVMRAPDLQSRLDEVLLTVKGRFREDKNVEV